MKQIHIHPQIRREISNVANIVNDITADYLDTDASFTLGDIAQVAIQCTYVQDSQDGSIQDNDHKISKILRETHRKLVALRDSQ